MTAALQGRKIDKTAARFIADTINSDPGNVTVLALGPLTNIAMAFQVSPDVAKNIVSSSYRMACARMLLPSLGVSVDIGMQGELIVLGGAFDVEGNVNPAGMPMLHMSVQRGCFTLAVSCKGDSLQLRQI